MFPTYLQNSLTSCIIAFLQIEGSFDPSTGVVHDDEATPADGRAAMRTITEDLEETVILLIKLVCFRPFAELTSCNLAYDRLRNVLIHPRE